MYTGASEYAEIACAHADTVHKYIVRQDFSTYHQFNFCPDTYKPLKGVTGQGYSDDSCWSRGQAWGIYGFALMYRNTNNTDYIITSKNLAHYFIDNLDICGLPIWDFSTKNLNFRPWDSSAAAIAASGMLEIYNSCGDTFFLDAADRLLDAIICYCLIRSTKVQAILLHGCIGPAYSTGSQNTIKCDFMDTPTVYGDYFFVEAIAKRLNPKLKLFW